MIIGLVIITLKKVKGSKVEETVDFIIDITVTLTDYRGLMIFEETSLVTVL